MTANRVSGLAVFLFGLVMIAIVIPVHTEEVGSGWMKPDTLPLACCYALAALGIIQAVRAQGETTLGLSETARFFAAAVIVAGCAWVMGAFGFLAGAIPAVLLLMIVSGERRIALIAAVSLLFPTATWLVVEQLLGRLLP